MVTTQARIATGTATSRKPLFIGMLVAVMVLLADQTSKLYFLKIIPKDPIEMTSFFNLVRVWNTGVSFGLAGGSSKWVLIGLTGVISLFVVYWLLSSKFKGEAFGIGLILGGAIGNLIDRLRYGAVFDFLDFHYNNWHWPAFNVADMAVVVGVTFSIIYMGKITKNNTLRSTARQNTELTAQHSPTHSPTATTEKES